MENIIHLWHAKNNKLKPTAMDKKHNALIMLRNSMMAGFSQSGDKGNSIVDSM